MAYEYLLTSLPAMPVKPASPPQIEPDVLWRIIKLEDDRLKLVAYYILLSFDLLCLENVQRGIDSSIPSSIFTRDEIKNKEGFPYWLELSLERALELGDGYPFEIVWEDYYSEMSRVAIELGLPIFNDWVSFEHALRRDVKKIRSGEGVPGYENFMELMNDDDPLKIDKFLTMRRFDWLNDRSKEYTFDIEEALGYVIRYKVLKECEYIF